MTGDLIVDADVHAKRVETLYVDSGENSNLKLQHDGITKVYVGREQVTVTNPLQLNTEGTLDDHAVTKKYIDDTFILKDGDKVEGELRWDKFKPASGSDPLENAYHGIKIASRDGGYIFVASTGGTYSEEELTTDLVPTTPTSIVNKAYVDAAVSPGVTLFGDGGKWRTLNEGSTIERYIYFQIAKKGSDSPYIAYGNVLYLDKLIAADGTLQSLKDYTPTDVSMLEVYVSNELYFKGLLNPTTYKVAQRNNNEIVCDFASEFPLVAKGGTDWSTSTTYRLILTGMKKNG